MKKAFFAMISVMLSFVACTKESFDLQNDELQMNPAKSRSFEDKLRDFAISDYATFVSERGGNYESLAIESLEPITADLEPSRSGDTTKDTIAYIVNFQSTNGSIIIAGSRAVPLTTIAIMEESKMQLIDTAKYDGMAMFIDMATNYYYQLAGQRVIDAGIATAEEMSNKSRTEIHQLVSELSLDEEEIVIGPNTIDPSQTTSTPWVITKREIMVPVMWGQDHPFNLATPTQIYIDILGGGTQFKKTLVGCVAVAIGQITTYHKFPKTLDHNILDWHTLTKTNPQTPDFNVIAPYLARIGHLADNSWGVNATGSTDKKARRAFQRLGYSYVPRPAKYRQNLVEESMSNHLPAYISGCRVKHEFIVTWYDKGHAWVVDGTLEREKTYTYYNYDGDIVSTNLFKQSFFHCNWGWVGLYNGFFHKGVFNASEGPVFQDRNGQLYSASNNSTYNYQYDLSMMINIQP
ncbi:C10 family peptidase [Porphyromonas loveana]|uniref:C10 family peptidase n=1 Tax=Porphyromonas loveana TaxID=1884669 RepID=UPI0035A05A9C